MITKPNPVSSSPDIVLKFSEKPFNNLTGVQLPGITPSTQKVVLELLEKNHNNFHIFFNDKGYHNHFVHHLLAAYACGGSSNLMKRLYDKYASYQRPKPPSQVTITRENWTEYLGRNDLWTDYLNFFDSIIKEEGMQKAFETFVFHPKMFPRLYAGAFHPVIHLDYAVEFQIPLVLAEGTEKKKILQIVEEVDQDKRFDIITYEVKGKLKKLVAERSDVVREIVGSWNIQEIFEGVEEAIRELYEACALLHGATPIRPDKDKIELDFLIMHGLTSLLLLTSILPYVSLERRILLLRTHFAAVLSQYIAGGRPKLHIDMLANYVPKKLQQEPNPWLDVIRCSLLEEDETHVLKVVRSLLKAEREWGSPIKEDLYVKIAQLTYEGYEKFEWGFDIGFEEEWR